MEEIAKIEEPTKTRKHGLFRTLSWIGAALGVLIILFVRMCPVQRTVKHLTKKKPDSTTLFNLLPIPDSSNKNAGDQPFIPFAPHIPAYGGSNLATPHTYYFKVDSGYWQGMDHMKYYDLMMIQSSTVSDKVYYDVLTKKASTFNYAMLKDSAQRKLVDDYVSEVKDAMAGSDYKALDFFSRSTPRWLINYYLAKEPVVNLTRLEVAGDRKLLAEEDERPLSTHLSELSPDDFGKFYVFDIFVDGICEHGDKVMDVIRQELALYHISPDVMMQKVVAVPVNYFSHIQYGDSVIRNWVDQGNTPTFVPLEWKERYKGNSEKTTANYLAAIYQRYCDSTPDIVSSSYIADCDVDYFSGAINTQNTEERTNFFTAADNDTSAVERYSKQWRRPGEPNLFAEPITAYLDEKPPVATVIVGNQLDSGNYHSNYSRTGQNVTVLGKGHHWGLVNCTRCIADTETGTSFATPDIATKMFVAKAFWRKNKDTLSAFEARARMILATDLQLPFVGKFASGGGIDLDKLLQRDTAYLVTREDSIIAVDAVFDANFTELKADYEAVTRFSQVNIPGKKTVRGMYSESGYTFVLYNNATTFLWEKILKPATIRLDVRFHSDGSRHTIDAREFYTRYKQFVLLKTPQYEF